MTLLLIGSLVLTLSILVIVLFRRAPSPDAASAAALQQQVESLRADMRMSLHQIGDMVHQQMAAVTQQMQSQTHTVGDRLDAASRVMGDVQKNLGELGRAAEDMKELGQNIGRLEELLKAPKLRGGLGEFFLEDVLRQVLPGEHFQMQYRFRGGQVVDAVIRTADRLIPIDAKFPLENFRRMAEGKLEAEKKTHQKAFLGDVRKHIDDIAAKYILPDEGTFPFALMYIPAESIYYEIIVHGEASGNAELYDYAIRQRVIPVSPNTFYTYLQVITLGLRGLSIEHSAQEIMDGLVRLASDMGRVREAFTTLGAHLENARKKYEEADRRLSGFEAKLDTIADHRLAEAPAENLLAS